LREVQRLKTTLADHKVILFTIAALVIAGLIIWQNWDTKFVPSLYR